MGKRKYTHVKELESIIISLRESGLTRQEIADELGLTKIQIKSWINRYNRRNEQIKQGNIAKPKGRPRKYPLSSNEAYEIEISRLRMENKLLRDFLQSTERK